MKEKELIVTKLFHTHIIDDDYTDGEALDTFNIYQRDVSLNEKIFKSQLKRDSLLDVSHDVFVMLRCGKIMKCDEFIDFVMKQRLNMLRDNKTFVRQCKTHDELWSEKAERVMISKGVIASSCDLLLRHFLVSHDELERLDVNVIRITFDATLYNEGMLSYNAFRFL